MLTPISFGRSAKANNIKPGDTLILTKNPSRNAPAGGGNSDDGAISEISPEAEGLADQLLEHLNELEAAPQNDAQDPTFFQRCVIQ